MRTSHKGFLPRGQGERKSGWGAKSDPDAGSIAFGFSATSRWLHQICTIKWGFILWRTTGERFLATNKWTTLGNSRSTYFTEWQHFQVYLAGCPSFMGKQQTTVFTRGSTEASGTLSPTDKPWTQKPRQQEVAVCRRPHSQRLQLTRMPWYQILGSEATWETLSGNREFASTAVFRDGTEFLSKSSASTVAFQLPSVDTSTIDNDYFWYSLLVNANWRDCTLNNLTFTVCQHSVNIIFFYLWM